LNQNEAMTIYAALMAEARWRIEIIRSTLANPSGYPVAMVRESCYLQFRFLCEGIALGCLAVHGDIKPTQEIKNAYQADKIIKALNRLKPAFYPQPMDAKFEAGGWHLIGKPEFNHLTKDDLIKLWREAGEMLHRGRFSEVVAQMKPFTLDSSYFVKATEWMEKIVSLLTQHWITLEENKKGMLVNIKPPQPDRVLITVLDFSVQAGSVSPQTFHL
jgi:hypothetical protein